MKALRAAVLLIAFGLTVTPALAQGSRDYPAPPSDEAVLEGEPGSEIDRRLMEALEEEYGRGDEPGFPESEASAFVAEEVEPDWRWLDLSVSFWALSFEDSELQSRTGSVSGRFDIGEDGAYEYESEGTPLYKVAFGLHPAVSIEALYYQARFDASEELGENLLFADRGFIAGDRVETEARVTALDVDIAVHAVRLDWLRFDVLFGVRYFKTELEISGAGDGLSASRERFEMVTPMIGLRLVVRPFDAFEVYATLRVGAIEYDGGDSDRRRSGFDDDEEIDDRTLSIATLESGVRIWFGDSLAFGAGLRVEAFEQERFRGDRGESVLEGAVGGPFLSATLAF